MLPATHRLHLRFDRANVEAASQTFSSPLFTLIYAQLPERIGQPSRFAFVVSKKISKKAVVRNKIRRHLSEAILTTLPSLKPGFDVMVLVRPSIVNVEFDKLKQAIRGSLSQIGAY